MLVSEKMAIMLLKLKSIKGIIPHFNPKKTI